MYENNQVVYDENQYQTSLSRHTAKTFLWMFLGLLVTFATGILVVVTPIGLSLVYANPAIPFILLIAELIIVMVLSARIEKLSVGAATGLFFAYAAVNGLTFSSIFLLYDLMDILIVFGLTSLFFGSMALYGYITKKDLTKIGRVLMFGVFFLLAFWLVSIFIHLPMLETIVCFIGFAIFLGLTAYDTQKIKAYHATFTNNPEMLAKASIFSALQLYLDFINIFMYVLRILGRSRN